MARASLWPEADLRSYSGLVFVVSYLFHCPFTWCLGLGLCIMDGVSDADTRGTWWNFVKYEWSRNKERTDDNVGPVRQDCDRRTISYLAF